MSIQEQDVQGKQIDSLHLTEEFKDFAELKRAMAGGPLKYGLVAVVQEMRRHPNLQAGIESVARRLGREIDLTQRLT